MAVSRIGVVLGLFVGLMVAGSVSSAKFEELFQPSRAADHHPHEGDVLELKLDYYSGAGFSSKSKCMFGKVTVQIKLVEGDSPGTVTTFYMSSEGPSHNGFDFEFLGNTTGKPYLVHLSTSSSPRPPLRSPLSHPRSSHGFPDRTVRIGAAPRMKQTQEEADGIP